MELSGPVQDCNGIADVPLKGELVLKINFLIMFNGNHSYYFSYLIKV
jgi:hypothetical protein